MMTKKLKIATRCPVNPRYKECNVNWFYCKKPSKNKTNKNLNKKLGHFDSNIVVLESQLALVNHVTDVLRGKFDDQEQYYRRPCLVIEGIRSRNNETEESLTNSVIDIIKTLALYHVSKKTLENGNPTAHVVYAKHFCNMLVLYSSTAARPS